MIIAIQPDNYGTDDASSPIWTRSLLEAGCRVKEVNVYQADILDQLKSCDGFMWRWGHFGGMGRIARRLLPVVQNGLGIPVYPDQNTCWHYDDKLAQAYLFQAHAIPTPKTWPWFDHHMAREWAATADYPLVLKLASGAGSLNVQLIRDFAEASLWIDRLFTRKVTSLEKLQFQPYGAKQRLANAVKLLLQGDKPIYPDDGYEAQSGYVYFQEFLPGNQFDTRVTVIGNRAFAFRRFNRAGDFRASGSGKIDYSQHRVDSRFVSLAFDVSRKLKTQSCAIDGLYREGQPVVGEISYTYVSGAVRECPGHWDRDLNWHDGPMWPEEAQVQDFLQRLSNTRLSGNRSHDEG